jgi:hypothetical protein
VTQRAPRAAPSHGGAVAWGAPCAAGRPHAAGAAPCAAPCAALPAHPLQQRRARRRLPPPAAAAAPPGPGGGDSFATGANAAGAPPPLVNISGVWAKDEARSDGPAYERALDLLGLSGLQRLTAKLIDGLEIRQVSTVGWTAARAQRGAPARAAAAPAHLRPLFAQPLPHK